MNDRLPLRRLLNATAAIQRALREREAPQGRVVEGAVSRVEESPLEGGGQFIAGSYANKHGRRPYKLYVPRAHAGQARPLIVMLHGCTQTPDDFAAGTRMNALAEERQCFVLYPGQTQAANQSRCWNWFQRGDQRRDSGEPAILAGMTREIAGRYGIDPRKIYVAGLSAGGAMAAVMAAAYPDLYAGVGIHSGLAVGSAHDVPSAFAAMRGASSTASTGSGGIPVIVFHGDRDATVHPSNGDRHAIPGTTSSVERGRAPGGRAYTRTLHRDPQGRIVLEHWLVHGAGHAWSGGSARGSYTDSKGPDAAQAMLRFFLRC